MWKIKKHPQKRNPKGVMNLEMMEHTVKEETLKCYSGLHSSLHSAIHQLERQIIALGRQNTLLSTRLDESEKERRRLVSDNTATDKRLTERCNDLSTTLTDLQQQLSSIQRGLAGVCVLCI